MSNEFKVKNGIITSSLKFLNFEQNKPLIVNETGQVVTTELYSNESLFSIEVEKSGNSVRILTTSASSNLIKYVISFVLNKF